MAVSPRATEAHGMVNEAKKPVGNPKVAGAAGLTLFMLGMLSVLLVYLKSDNSPQTVKLVLGAAVLLSLSVAGIQRLEARVAELEGRAR